MKKSSFVLPVIALFLTACAGQNNVIIIPDPTHEQQYINIDPFEHWEIIESRDGTGEARIPLWVRFFYHDKFNGIELLEEYNDKYMFTGESRGENYNALQQWANGFSTIHDLPRLIAARVEHRLVSAASLYPDDEYGQFFENLIKTVSDREYPEAVKEEIFWLKRRVLIQDEEINYYDEPPPTENIQERYEFLILISIDRETLQSQLREIMANVRTATPLNRDQAGRVSRIQQTFFEGF